MDVVTRRRVVVVVEQSDGVDASGAEVLRLVCVLGATSVKCWWWGGAVAVKVIQSIDEVLATGME